MASRPDDAPTHLDAKLDAVLIGGREPVTIQVVDYDSGWPERFEAEQWRIATALGPLARRVEHIGSTAVPGLAAKPVVDMLVEVDDPDDEERYRPQMESAGFQLRAASRAIACFARRRETCTCTSGRPTAPRRAPI